MATLTIRNIDDTVKERLRVLAATHGHSMEGEARLILHRAVGAVTGARLWEQSRDLFSGVNGRELETPRLSVDRSVPGFEDSGGA